MYESNMYLKAMFNALNIKQKQNLNNVSIETSFSEKKTIICVQKCVCLQILSNLDT